MNRGYRDGHLPRCYACDRSVSEEAERRRIEAPLTPLRYYVNAAGYMRCLKCDGQAMNGEDDEIRCLLCGEYLNPPRRRILKGVAS